MDAKAYRSPRGFRDRTEAGRMLAGLLARYSSRGDLVVLALPRGGVPVAAEIASSLGAPLDVIVVLKVSTDQHPELALGAVADGGSVELNEDLIERLGISSPSMTASIAANRAQIAGRVRSLRGDRAPIDLTGATVILVDDGLATGASMRAAIAAVRARDPANVVVAVPVASREAADAIGRIVDDFVAIACPASFVSVGTWYRSFAQVRDDEVRALLDRASHTRPAQIRERSS
jgi:putative phosphoribosyl transferase